jgi:hypothetical protein
MSKIKENFSKGVESYVAERRRKDLNVYILLVLSKIIIEEYLDISGSILYHEFTRTKLILNTIRR